MFTQEENDLLTQVGAGTPMGELMRRYWVPAFLAEELPEPGCAPVRTRLFGEDLVGFRDSHGRVGLLSEYCSHRQASLFYGRTHEDEPGLRCVYHGWKYDVDGRILETPAEPISSRLKDHIRHTAYPCVEINGLIMTYIDTVCLAGASTDNCVLWTAGEAHQYRYKVVVVEDCTIIHRQTAPQGRWQAAIDIMRDVAKGDILSTDEVVAKYFKKQ